MRLLLAAACLLSMILINAPAQAQDATWLANPTSGDFNTPANWLPAIVPGSATNSGTATFSTSATTNLSFSQDTTVGGWTFNAGASNYIFTNGNNLTFSGAGIVVKGGSATITNNSVGGALTFNGTSTAGTATITNGFLSDLIFGSSATAGSANITNNGSMQFGNSATAGTANIINQNTLSFNATSTAGSATITSNFQLFFNGTSTAGSATITNNAFWQVNDTSTAGSATITNNSSMQFRNTSTAGSANITNNNSLTFSDSSTAGNATITTTNPTFGSTVNFNDTSTAGSATITNNSTVNFNNTSTAGSATITNNAGSSTVNFNNTSTAGTATIINNSALNFNNASTAGSANITNNSNLNFSNSATAGNATITNTSGGLISFSGLSTGGNSRLINSATSFLVDFTGTAGPNNDHKVSLGSIEGGGAVFLGNNELTIGGNNLSTAFSGVIAGLGGSLVKVGTGTFALPATVVVGAATVSGGTLEVDNFLGIGGVTVNANGTLSGSGTVSGPVNVGGVLMPGAAGGVGTLFVSGNLAFQSGAIYLVQVTSAGAASTHVNGTAALAGNVVVNPLAPLTTASTFTILTSTGLGGTTFGSVSITNTFARNPVLSYVGNNVLLTLQPGLLTPILPVNANVNQKNLAGAVDTALLGGANLNAGFNTLFGLTGNALFNALTQGVGETATGSQQTTFGAMGQFMGLMGDPTSRGGLGGSPSTQPYADEETLSYAARQKTDAFAMFTKAPQNFEQRWSVWASAFGGSQNTSGNTVAGSNDTTSRIVGTAVGADYLFSPNTIAGFAMAGGGTNFSVVNGGTGRSDLFQFGGYVRHTSGAAYITGALAYGWQDVTTNRTVTIAGLDQLRAQFNANAWSGRLEGGYRYVAPVFGGLGITPYAAAQFVTLDLPAYAEQAIVGTNNFALAYGARDVTDVRSELGVRTDKSFVQGDGILTLRGRFAWAHDFNPDRAIAATFQALPGASFTVNGAAQAADSALTTASIEKRWKNGWSLAATFEGEFSRVTESYAGKGVVRYVW